MHYHAGTTVQAHTTGREIINIRTIPKYMPMEGLGQIEWIAIASVMVFTITSVSFLIIGLLCGKLCCKQKVIETHPREENPNLLYANVQLDQLKQLELNANVAYASIR